jgi:hypothetical protein
VAAPCSQLTKLNERIRPQAAAIPSVPISMRHLPRP